MMSERAYRFAWFAGFTAALNGGSRTPARQGAAFVAAYQDGFDRGRERRVAREHAEDAPPCPRTGIESDTCDCIDQEDRRA